MVQFYSAFSSTLTAFSAPNVVALNKIFAICNENAKQNGKTNAA